MDKIEAKKVLLNFHACSHEECGGRNCNQCDYYHTKEETDEAFEMAALAFDVWRCADRMEAKLKELLGEDGYREWSVDVAKEMFKDDVAHMGEGQFKDFCEEHLEEITK